MSEQVSLKELTTWKVGGLCNRFIAPNDLNGAIGVLRRCSDNGIKPVILGGGSNILVQDGIVDITVLHTCGMDDIAVVSKTGNKVKISVGCGCSTKKLMQFSMQNKLGGTEFLVGIPGTVGGALWGNAGGRSEEGFSDIVSSLTIIENNQKRVLDKAEINWKYRTCPVDIDSTQLIASAELELTETESSNIVAVIRKFANLKKGQPIGKNTAGCVFKNPVGNSAGKMLDECGCKGLSVGGAVVSESHANFVINTGTATATDIYSLCEICRNRVFDRFGIMLEYEIHFVGQF